MAPKTQWYASANMPEDDASPSGGAIDRSTLVVPESTDRFNEYSSSVRLTSSLDADTGIDATVHGRDGNGDPLQETLTLDGTTPVYGDRVFAWVERIALAAPAAGTVTWTISDGTVIVGELPPGVTGLRRLFVGATAPASGGTDRYEKIFLANDATESLWIGVVVDVQAQIFPTRAEIALEDVQDGTGSVPNRLTEPTAITDKGFQESGLLVPGENLAAGAAVGVWLKYRFEQDAFFQNIDVAEITAEGSSG